MTRDTSLYGSDPDEFRPERFADLSPSEAKRLDPRNIVFGYGRRCVLRIILHVLPLIHGLHPFVRQNMPRAQVRGLEHLARGRHHPSDVRHPQGPRWRGA